nr:uncharacterized protein LOC128693857 [Cherax quadricarinatus]
MHNEALRTIHVCPKATKNLNMRKELGCYVLFRKLPSRLVLMTVLLLQVVMLAHYTSTLVSALSVPPALPAISSISDLLRNPALSFGTTGDTAIIGYLKNSPRLDHQQAYAYMMADGGGALVASTAQGMARTLLENYVYLDTSLYLLSESDCRHVILPKAHFTAITSFALQKDSPLVPIFNKIILRIKAGGVLLNLERRWRPDQLNCEFTHASVIGMDAVFTPFLLLLLIMVLSVAVCVAEHLWRAVYTRTSTINTATHVNHTKNSQTF